MTRRATSWRSRCSSTACGARPSPGPGPRAPRPGRHTGPNTMDRYPHEFSGSASAHRHRPRPGGRAQLHRLRRAHQRARRLDPRTDHQPVARAAALVRVDLPVHRPRPVGRAPHLRPRGRYVPGAHRRAGRQPRALRRALPPLHAGAAVGRAHPRPAGRGAAAPRGARRRRAEPRLAALRLPLSHALSGSPGRPVRRRRPGAAQDQARPLRRLSPGERHRLSQDQVGRRPRGGGGRRRRQTSPGGDAL